MTELALFGTDLFGEVVRPKASGPLAERFTLPPFTIAIDAQRRFGVVAAIDRTARAADAYADAQACGSRGQET